MKRIIVLAVLFLMVNGAAAQVTGLRGWNVYLDPGHSQKENMGVMGWSEAEHSLRVALHLRQILVTETDVDTVFMARTNDAQQVGLTQRTNHANSTNADFFYSIHSDAAGPNVNSTLMLYGGWRQNGQTVEKTPRGGGRMGEILDDFLTAALRIPRRGNYADRTFYQGFPENHANQWPYLHVNRETNMASLLSEAGFHTNPTHNMRQMNTEFQQLQARATFWAFLRYHGIARPVNRIVTGLIIDHETGVFLNGATIEIGNRQYTTDTFESLFNRFPDGATMSNGFYYMEELPAGPLAVSVSAPGYDAWTGSITPNDTTFTFLDVRLISNQPPIVASTTPAQGSTGFNYREPIVINFSRIMDRESVQNAFSVSPEVAGTFTWSQNDFRVTFRPDSLIPVTDYTISIAGTAKGIYGEFLDGNRDGEEGGDFVLTFRTGSEDVEPPRLIAVDPAMNATGVMARPIITMTFDEPLDPATVTTERFLLAPAAGGPAVPGTLRYYVVGNNSTVSFFPTVDLQANTRYQFRILEGLKDLVGNAQLLRQFFFTTGDQTFQTTNIDTFEGTAINNWWQPQQSGSTTGIITEETARVAETTVVNVLSGSTQAMRIDYGFSNVASGLIRVHLGGGPARSVTFGTNFTMQAYVFGDGSGNQFRYAVRAADGGIGASQWITVNWFGWRLVSWEHPAQSMNWFAGATGLTPPYFIESIQIRPQAGALAIGSLVFDDLRLASSVAVNIDDETGAGLPVAMQLHQNYPNPFNPQTTLSFDLSKASEVTMAIYNVAGQRVATLYEGQLLGAGFHEVQWDARDLPSGVYFARMRAADFQSTVQMVLVK
jgi:N-acetylmuramoyl-L-alanine amidase